MKRNFYSLGFRRWRDKLGPFGKIANKPAPRELGLSNPGLEKLEPRQLLATVAIQSGDWHNPFTWDNGIPDATERAIVSQGLTVTLNGTDHVANEIVVHGVLNVAEDANPNTKTLTADWIHINSGGVFEIGSAADRFDTNQFQLTLTGTDITADHVVETTTGTMNVNDNDGFLMTAMSGQLQFFGAEKLTFTKLAATADVGSSSITVENIIERNFDGTTSAASDGQLDWEVGDQIVIASSSYDYADEEVRTITGVTDNGTTTVLTLNSPVSHRHYGEIETFGNGVRTWDIDMRAEVALLNRSITIQGTQDTDNNFGDRANFGSDAGQNLGIGAHTMVMFGSGQITVDGVRFDKMGQTAQLGRYPMHWHLAGDRTGDILRNSSVTNSNNRGVTIHGTQGLTLEGNVLHDIHGHGIFMEDAAETDNQFLNNITFGIHQVGGGTGGVLTSNDPFVVPGITRGANGLVNGIAAQGGNGESSHDTGQNLTNRFRHSAAYWITNPDNTWIGNISAGSEGSGFWFALPNRVLGHSLDSGLYGGVVPLQTNLLQFDHNTSHSTPVGLTFDRGSDIRGGGANHYFPPQTMQVNNYTAYKHIGTAVYHRATRGIFNESHFADNTTSSFNTFAQTERNVLFVGHSQGNADPQTKVGGYRLYDGPGHIIDSHFAGFAAENAHTFVVEGGANKHALTDATGITFENDGTANHISIDHLNQPAWNINNSPEFISARPDSVSGLVLDLDGSLTGHGGGGAGFVLTPKLDYFRDSNDIAPTGWNAYISNDGYAQFKIGINHNDHLSVQHVGGVQGEYIPEFRIENGDGHAILADRWNLTYVQRMYTKLNAGDYTIEFTNRLTLPDDATGFDILLQTRAGGQAGDSTVFRFVDLGRGFKPDSVNEVETIGDLRSATEHAFFRDLDGDLWMKVFADQTNGAAFITIPIEIYEPLVVDNTNDSGPGSLREAITTANSEPGLDVIEFDIPGTGAAQIIQPLTPLPSVTDRVIIDGATESSLPVPDGDFENPKMGSNRFEQANGNGNGTLDGSLWTITGAAGITRNFSSFQNNGWPAPTGYQHGLIQSGGSFSQTISGFEVGRQYELSLLTMARNFGHGGNDLNVVLDEGLKTELALIDFSEVTFDKFTKITSPTFVATKSSYMLTISADMNEGTLTGDRTTFFDDVQFQRIGGLGVPNMIVIDGKFVGVGDGLVIDAASSLISNLTVNNFVQGAGIQLAGSGSHKAEFVWAGLNIDGTIASSNAVGIRVLSDSNTVISSVFSGNSVDGVQVESATGNLIAANRIGTNALASAAMPNGENGILFDSSVSSIAFFNVIANNNDNGVVVVGSSSIGNTIRANVMTDNGMLAIDLGDDGVTANDELDVDSGPNELTNHPIVFSAKARGLTNTTITGGMVGLPNTTYLIDTYANDNLNANGHGGAQSFLKSFSVTTDHTGRAKFETNVRIERKISV